MYYLTAVGRGQTQQGCEADGRAGLAKIFKAQVSQIHKDWQGHISRINSAGASVHIEAMSVQQWTQVSTDYTLKGTKISLIWQGDGGYHCLATLERVPAAQTLRAEIGRLDAEISAQIAEGDRHVGKNVTARFLAYKKALDLFQKREALNADLRIVDAQRRGVETSYGWRQLIAKFTRAKAEAKIGFHLKGPYRAKIQSCLAEELKKQGISVLEGTSDVDLWIHGKIEMQFAGHNNGVALVRGTLNMRVTNPDDGRTVAAFSRDIKAGRAEQNQSYQLVASKLCFDVAPQLAQEINKSLAN